MWLSEAGCGSRGGMVWLNEVDWRSKLGMVDRYGMK